jgi:hypothetical protein
MRALKRGAGVAGRLIRVGAAAAAVLAAAACELREITVAEPFDIVVAEVILRAGEDVQTALLHRTVRLPATGVAVPGAVVEVRSADGRSMRYAPVPIARCLQGGGDASAGQPPATERERGSCYAAEGNVLAVREGQRYTLRILLPDGREMSGTTLVPGNFRFRSPVSTHCVLPPDTRLTLAWTPADDTWAYLAEARFEGLRAAYAPRGIRVPEDPLTLLGLAISRADTTMQLPAGFGVFDRFDSDLAPTLLALQQGIPAGVTVDVAVAATDRNFVNWVRGGNFNPSGQVRVPSIVGEGTGVFASLVARTARIETTPQSALPPCAPGAALPPSAP